MLGSTWTCGRAVPGGVDPDMMGVGVWAICVSGSLIARWESVMRKGVGVSDKEVKIGQAQSRSLPSHRHVVLSSKSQRRLLSFNTLPADDQ